MKQILLLLPLLMGLLSLSCSEEKPKKTKAVPVKKEVIEIEEPKSYDTTEPAAKEEAPKAEPVPPEQLEKAKALITSVSDDDLAAVDGKAKFKQFCAACHGLNGELKINGAKDLTISTISLEESVAQIYHGKGLMTPFKGLLKDAEVVAVAKFIEKEFR